MRSITTFLLLFIFANGSCNIDFNLTYVDCRDSVKVIFDKNDSYVFEQLIDSNDSTFEPSKRKSLGYQNATVYSKLTLKYSGDIEKRVVLVNPKVSIDDLEVLIYENKKLLKLEILGDQRENNFRELKNRYSLFPITLYPNREIEIISKIPAGKSVVEIGWIVAKPDVFFNFIIKESIWWGVFVGIIFSLIFYNSSIYFSLKDYTYLIYGALSFSLMIYQLSKQGILYEFFSTTLDLYFIGLLAWIFAGFSMGFLFLFAILFFNTKVTMPKIHKFLLGLALFYFSMGFLFIYAYFDTTLLFKVRNIITPLFILSFLIPPILGIYAYTQKLVGAIYYLIGHGIYSVTLFYQHFDNVYGDKISILSIYSATIGILFEVVFLSLALSNRIKELRIQKEIADKMLVSQANISAIGRAIGDISHQWRNAIQKISSINLTLMGFLNKGVEIPIPMLSKATKDIDKTILFMSETMSSFLDYYRPNQTLKEFTLNESINDAINILENKIKKKSVIINFNGDIKITGSKNEWIQIWLNLINNAIDIGVTRSIQKIEIDIKIEDKSISVSDNCGGIEESILNSINSSKYSGLGIRMCRDILMKYNKILIVKNSNFGAYFEILDTQ